MNMIVPSSLSNKEVIQPSPRCFICPVAWSEAQLTGGVRQEGFLLLSWIPCLKKGDQVLASSWEHVQCWWIWLSRGLLLLTPGVSSHNPKNSLSELNKCDVHFCTCSNWRSKSCYCIYEKKTVTSLLRESDNIFYGKIIDLTSFQKKTMHSLRCWKSYWYFLALDWYGSRKNRVKLNLWAQVHLLFLKYVILHLEKLWQKA